VSCFNANSGLSLRPPQCCEKQLSCDQVANLVNGTGDGRGFCDHECGCWDLFGHGDGKSCNDIYWLLKKIVEKGARNRLESKKCSCLMRESVAPFLYTHFQYGAHRMDAGELPIIICGKDNKPFKCIPEPCPSYADVACIGACVRQKLYAGYHHSANWPDHLTFCCDRLTGVDNPKPLCKTLISLIHELTHAGGQGLHKGGKVSGDFPSIDDYVNCLCS